MISFCENGSLLLKFGTGDIGIHIGGVEGCGALMFQRQEPQKVKYPKNLGSVRIAGPEEFPVSMLFTNPDSIDVFMQSLQTAKNILTGNLTLHPEGTEQSNFNEISNK